MPATSSRLSSFATTALLVLAVVAMVSIALRNRPGGGAPDKISEYIGRPAPDFTLPDLTGREVSLASLKGQVVVLDIWATWCPPCVEELPANTAITARYADRGVAFYAINLGESAEKVKAFLEREKLNTPVLLDQSEQIGQRYGAQYIPLLVVIDRTGRIVAHGNVPPDEVEKTLPQWIESALKSGEAS